MNRDIFSQIYKLIKYLITPANTLSAIAGLKKFYKTFNALYKTTMVDLFGQSPILDLIDFIIDYFKKK
jgi:hypothetical protein